MNKATARRFKMLAAVSALTAVLVLSGCGGKDAKDNPVPAADTSGTAEGIVSDTSTTDTATTATAQTNDDSETENLHSVHLIKPTGRIQAVYESNTGYRKMSRTEIPDTSNLIGLFHENDIYYLRQAKITFKDGLDECTGLPILYLVSAARFLFLNFINYNQNKIQAIPLPLKKELGERKDIFPDEKFTFDFGNEQYELEAFGEKKNGTDKYNVKNFSLVYSIKGAAKKQMIVSIPQIEHTNVTLLFIGDLDGDGKPDIILDAPSNYENEEIMVFLSSTAKVGEYLRREAHKFDSFDC